MRLVDYDYSKRGYLLPEGCKDLTDVINPSSVIGMESVDVVWRDGGLLITAKWPNLRSEGIEIAVEGRRLRVVHRTTGNQISHEYVMEVPAGCDLSRASATYVKDTLRIFIPKC